MSHFCLLEDPESYCADDWDLVADEVGRAYWLDHFAQEFEASMQKAEQHYGRTAARKIEAAKQEFLEVLDGIRQDPTSHTGGRLNVMEMDRLRAGTLAKHGLVDPYKPIKDQTNTKAMDLYPEVVRRLHAMDDDQKWLYLIEAVLAGNCNDVGATETMFLADRPDDFLQLIEGIKPRPWLVDDFDTVAEGLAAMPPAWGKALVFIDNAGADFVCGVMPLAREMALRGTMVVLAANETPSLNDLTVEETVEIIEQLSVGDPDLAALIEAGMFEVVSTGSGIPLIDLSDVSDELNAAAEDADLVILEGMGRAIESNYHARFKVDCLKLALLKSEPVAKRLDGEAFDCVCRFEKANTE